MLPLPVPGPPRPGGSPPHLRGPLLKQLQRGRRAQGYDISFLQRICKGRRLSISTVSF